MLFKAQCGLLFPSMSIFGKMVTCFKEANLLDHSVISTLVKTAFIWIKFDCEIFATVRQKEILFILKNVLYVRKYTTNCTPREPNLSQNAVHWETQPNACFADGQVNKKTNQNISTF